MHVCVHVYTEKVKLQKYSTFIRNIVNNIYTHELWFYGDVREMLCIKGHSLHVHVMSKPPTAQVG